MFTGGLCGWAGRLLGLRECLVDDAKIVVDVRLLQQVGQGRLRLLAPLLTGVRPAKHNKFNSNCPSGSSVSDPTPHETEILSLCLLCGKICGLPFAVSR